MIILFKSQEFELLATGSLSRIKIYTGGGGPNDPHAGIGILRIVFNTFVLYYIIDP